MTLPELLARLPDDAVVQVAIVRAYLAQLERQREEMIDKAVEHAIGATTASFEYQAGAHDMRAKH